MTEEKDNGNISKQHENPRPWSREEMEEAQPYPIPEIEDKDDANKKNRDKEKKRT